MEINSEDLTKYKAFLSSPNTGVFKLLPVTLACKGRGGANPSMQRLTNILSYANAFSFRVNKHVYFVRSDLRLHNSRFDAKGSEVQTILVNIGDIPLEQINDKTEEVKYLSEFKPESQIVKVREQFEMFRKGVKSNTRKYSKSVKAKLNNTYALRSIAYNYVNHPNPKDVLDAIVVFRVIRKEKGGSLTILWKFINWKPAPDLKK